jgi:hypothetical protein
VTDNKGVTGREFVPENVWNDSRFKKIMMESKTLTDKIIYAKKTDRRRWNELEIAYIFYL